MVFIQGFWEEFEGQNEQDEGSIEDNPLIAEMI